MSASNKPKSHPMLEDKCKDPHELTNYLVLLTKTMKGVVLKQNTCKTTNATKTNADKNPLITSLSHTPVLEPYSIYTNTLEGRSTQNTY